MIGGFILLASGVLFLVILARGMRAARPTPEPIALPLPCTSRSPFRSRSTRFGAVGGADDRAHHHQLRLSDRCSCWR